MKRILPLILVLISVFTFGCSQKTDPCVINNSSQIITEDNVTSTKNKKKSSKTITLNEYISKYNESLRNTVSVYINKNVSDYDYIACAKTIMDKVLKNPSTAQYNDSYVYEKDDYGRAIVFLDISAQNGFGGWVRSNYYVCIKSVDKDGTFTYSTTVPYVDDKSDYNTLLILNDFGKSPADNELEGLIINENGFVNEYETGFNISPSQTLDCYKAVMKYGIQFAYVDSKTKEVVSLRFHFTESSNSEKSEKILPAMVNALTGIGKSDAKNNIENVLSISSLSPTNTPIFHNDGYVYDCAYGNIGLDFAITAVAEKTYKKGVYWTPNNASAYYENLADQYAKKGDYDNAIIYYENCEIDLGDKLLDAYYQKADQSLKKGELDEASKYFGMAGDYKDSAMRVLEVSYSAGQEHEKNKDYQSAIQSYSLAGNYSDAAEKYKECNFKQGEIYIKDTQYLEAAQCFEQAGNYSNATERSKESYYLYADQSLVLGDVETASMYFVKAGDYKDASVRVQKYYYDKGLNLLASKDYIQAAENFVNAYGYSDAADKEKECYYLLGKEKLALNYITDAVEYLSKCRGYKDTDDILLGYYYGEASRAVDILIGAFPSNSFAATVDNAYEDARNKLLLCEGYKDSEYLLTIVEKLYYVFSEMQFESNFEASLNGMTASYSGDTISITKSKFMSGTSCTLSLTHNIKNNTFSADITHMFNLSARESDVRKVISALLVLFTDIKNTSDFDSNFSNKNNWSISEEKESFTMSYGGYRISITTKPEQYGYIDCKISVTR